MVALARHGVRASSGATPKTRPYTHGLRGRAGDRSPASQGLGTEMVTLRLARAAIRRIGPGVPCLGAPAAHRAFARHTVGRAHRQSGVASSTARQARAGLSGSPGDAVYASPAQPASARTATSAAVQARPQAPGRFFTAVSTSGCIDETPVEPDREDCPKSACAMRCCHGLWNPGPITSRLQRVPDPDPLDRRGSPHRACRRRRPRTPRARSRPLPSAGRPDPRCRPSMRPARGRSRPRQRG